MAGLYSERLYGPAQPGTVITALFTCPAGQRALVKELMVVADGASTCPVDVFVNNGVTRARYVKTATASGQNTQIDCRLVLYPGDILEAQRLTVGTTCKVTVNGYLFDE